MPRLDTLPVGARFLAGRRRGRIIFKNTCRVRVELEEAPKTVTIAGRTFQTSGRRLVDWAPGGRSGGGTRGMKTITAGIGIAAYFWAVMYLGLLLEELVYSWL
jgi:hypothetical protein